MVTTEESNVFVKKNTWFGASYSGINSTSHLIKVQNIDKECHCNKCFHGIF